MHLWARMAGKRSVTCLMTHQHPTLLIHRRHIIGIFMLRLMGHTVVTVADLVLSLKHAMERALREYLFLMLRRITMSLNIARFILDLTFLQRVLQQTFVLAFLSIMTILLQQ
jgi:hypothetical protein